MADMTLNGQCQAAQAMLRAGQLEQAAQLCRRILTAFPRYASAYAILGQVYLRLGEHEEAANLFRRVLSVDPEHTLAYASLGLIYAERGLLDEAVWQLERALELSPGNRELRLELADLYAERDGGSERRRIKPSGGALVRAYMRGQLYAKAIGEARQLLSQAPERLDLRVVLLEALWRAKRFHEAEVVALGILDVLPNCLKANLIMGALWLNGEQDQQARRHLHRAQELDPNNALAQELFGTRSPLPPRVARLPLDEASLEPLDLPYLMQEHEVIDGVIGAPAAPLALDEVLAQSADAAVDVPDGALDEVLAQPSDASPDEAAVGADERLRLARTCYEAGELEAALAHYAWLLLHAPALELDVRSDLDLLRASHAPHLAQHRAD